jgi:hypothetical protein
MFGVGQSVGAYALLATILTTLTLQILLVVIQNAHRGPIAVFKEVLIGERRARRGPRRGRFDRSAHRDDDVQASRNGVRIDPGGLLQAIFVFTPA